MSEAYLEMDSPLGPLTLRASAEALHEIQFRSAESFPPQGDDPRALELVERARGQLQEYFAGERKEFSIPLRPRGTEFQQRVWSFLGRIPYGKTCSYSDLARQLGQPTASRAVGAANGKNPVPIMVPCHRVIGQSGRLTGYAGGLTRKEQLLRLEGVQVQGPTLW